MVDSPVVHETGVAERSPGYQDRDPREFIVHHLPERQDIHGIGFDLPHEGQTKN